MAMSQKFCAKCGSPIKPGAKFCPKCGAPAKAPTKQETTDTTEETRAPKKKEKSSSAAKWVILALLLVLLIGGGRYFAYDYFVNTDDNEEEEVAGESDEALTTDDFLGYWSAVDEEGTGFYLAEETFTTEVDEEVEYYEVHSFELDETQARIEISPLEEETEKTVLLDREEESLFVEDSSGEVTEFESVSEEDYLEQGGLNLRELSEDPQLETEEVEDEEGLSLSDPDAGIESSEDSSDEESEEQAEDLDGEFSFSDVAGFYIDDTEYGQFVYYINENYVSSYLFNPTGGPERWTVIDLESYSIEENRFEFSGAMLHDILFQEGGSLEETSDEFSFDTEGSTISMATSGYATEFSFTKLDSVDDLINEIGSDYGDPYGLFDSLYDELNNFY